MDVSQEEKQSRWLDAAKVIEQSLMSESHTDDVAAEYWQRIGFCYFFASRQAEDVEDFRKLSLQSAEAYDIYTRLD